MGKDSVKDVEERLSGQINDLEVYLEKIFKKMDGMKEAMKELGERMEAKMEGIEAKMDELAKKVNDLEKRTSVLEDRVLEMGKDSSNMEAKMVKEFSEMEAKRNNIVVFGVPEPSSSNGESPRDKDVKVIDGILEKIIGEKIAFDLKFRIGQKQDGKVRPIVISMRNIGDKESVLKNANRLRDHQTWSKIYLKPDLTKSQREFVKAQEAELKVEAARRNSLLKNGESWEWKIRGRGLQHHLAKVTIRD